MSVGEIFPLILFGISIMFSTLLFLIKNKKLNINEMKKTIRENSEKAIKNLEQKVVETEELVSLKQVEAQKTCDFVDRKIKELMDDGEELNQLGDALNKYRSMLAQLNFSTSQVEAFVVRANNDAKKLQELQHLIDSHEKKTYNILQAFDSGLKEQTFQLETIKTEIVSQTESSINQIVTTRDDSLSEVMAQITRYQELSDSYDEIQSTHNAILKELIEKQVANKANLAALNKDFEEKCDSYLNETKKNLDEYLSQMKTSTNDKLSLAEESIVKNFERDLNRKKEDTLLRIDDVLTSSIKTIALYDEKLNKSYENSNLMSTYDNQTQKIENKKEDKKDNKKVNKKVNKKINKKEVSNDILVDSQATIPKVGEPVIINSINKNNKIESIKREITPDLFDDMPEESENLQNEKESLAESSKKESKLKKKKNRRNKKSKDDDIEIIAGIDLIDLVNEKKDCTSDIFNGSSKNSSKDITNHNLSGDVSSLSSDDKNLLEERVPKDIGDINLDDLASIDATFCGVVKKDVKELKEVENKEVEINETKVKYDNQKNSQIKTEINKKEVEKVESSNVGDKYETLSEIQKDQIAKKLNGTGFGNLLNSYGSQKRVDNETTKKNSVKTFKPGSIIEMVVDEDRLKYKENAKIPEYDVSNAEPFAKKEEDTDGVDKNRD